MISRYIADKCSRCCYKNAIKSYARHYKTLYMMSNYSDSLEDHRNFILCHSYAEVYRKRHLTFETFIRTPRPLWKRTTNNTSYALKELQKSRAYNDTKIFG
jgi:hypothetical protein